MGRSRRSSKSFEALLEANDTNIVNSFEFETSTSSGLKSPSPKPVHRDHMRNLPGSPYSATETMSSMAGPSASSAYAYSSVRVIFIGNC
jgi:hypothetical protein